MNGTQVRHGKGRLAASLVLTVSAIFFYACAGGTFTSPSDTSSGGKATLRVSTDSSADDPTTTDGVFAHHRHRGPTIIGFDGLTVNGAPVSTYTESGFTVSATSGPWVAVTTYGHPAPFIDFSAPGGGTVIGEVRVTADHSSFSFESVDLYSSTTPIPYVFTGLRHARTVFTVAGTVPNTFGNFATVGNPHAVMVIDTLSIVLTNAAAPCCTNPMGMDNIALTQ